jgi:hypothetical protein
MITTAYLIKKARGEYDGISVTQPDATFDDTKGYTVSFRLIVRDGTNWVCDDATTGAAVWTQDTSKDTEISEAIVRLTQTVCIYLDNYFFDESYWLSISNLVFAGDVLTWTGYTGNGFSDVFISGDSVWIGGSRRNDGPYKAVTVTDGTITVDRDFRVDMTDPLAVRLLASVFPSGLQEAAGRLGAYDVWERPEQPSGIVQESIGSYSYTLETSTINGIPYPEDMVSALNPWRRPKFR